MTWEQELDNDPEYQAWLDREKGVRNMAWDKDERERLNRAMVSLMARLPAGEWRLRNVWRTVYESGAEHWEAGFTRADGALITVGFDAETGE